MSPCPGDEKERIGRELRALSLSAWTLILTAGLAGLGWMPLHERFGGRGVAGPAMLGLSWALGLAGTVLWVRRKNRSWRWSLLGLLGCWAPLLLADLKSRCRHCGALESTPSGACNACDAPF